MLSLGGCLKLESDIDQEELCLITHDSFGLIFYDRVHLVGISWGRQCVSHACGSFGNWKSLRRLTRTHLNICAYLKFGFMSSANS